MEYYKGTNEPHDGIERLPAPPPWRDFTNRARRDKTYIIGQKEIDLVNAALLLRRPLFITGMPGSGKSSLAYAVAHELKLGNVLRWSITSRSTLLEGLYSYDAIARLQDANLERFKDNNAEPPDIGKYIQLGPLGTALLRNEKESPRVLLIDELDKSDIDLPNDLLHIFEEGEFVIPELKRQKSRIPRAVVQLPDDHEAEILEGQVTCRNFPFVIITSNGERVFPPAFLRRCLPLEMDEPKDEKLRKIAAVQLGPEILESAEPFINEFLQKCAQGDLLATDQLLNLLHMVLQSPELLKKDTIRSAVLRSLTH